MRKCKRVLLLVLFLWMGALGLCLLIYNSLLLQDIKSSKGEERLSAVSDAYQNRQLDDVIHIVIASDNNTLGGMIALINSIVSNTKSSVFFHLITDQKTSGHLHKWLTQSRLHSIQYEIQEFPVDWVVGKIKLRGGRTELANPLNYARFYLPRLFPDITGRVVYIDDDCIVQGDIAELYFMDLNPGTLVSFAEDCGSLSRHISSMQNVYADFFDVKNKHYQTIGISPQTCSFNTGVFVTNLSEWRQHSIMDQLEYWMELNTREELYGNEKGGGGSQPPMMLVFYKKYTPLSSLWHVRYLGWTAKTRYSHQFIKSAKLLHWNGRFKPWGPTSAFQEVWDLYFIPDPTGQFQSVRKMIA